MEANTKSYEAYQQWFSLLLNNGGLKNDPWIICLGISKHIMDIENITNLQDLDVYVNDLVTKVYFCREGSERHSIIMKVAEKRRKELEVLE